MKYLTLIFLVLLWTAMSMAQNKALFIGVGSHEPSTSWKSIGSCNNVDILSKSLPTSFHIFTLTNKKATVKVNSQNDWQSVLDSLIEFVKGKGLGETQNLQIMFDAQPA